MKVSSALFAFAGLVISSPASSSEQGDAEDAFLEVPGSIAITGGEEAAFKRLPQELREILESSNAAGLGDFRGFVYDLNKDGQSEYFVDDQAAGGTGGSCYEVYARVEGVWRLALDFQGALYAFPTKKGWPRLVSISRAGGQAWTKCYWEFKKGAYHKVLVERYAGGSITKEKPPLR